MAVRFPEHDLEGEYRALLAADPGNGALCYLLARQVAGRDEQADLWTRALSASPPCHYAYLGLGYDAASACRFEEALDYYEASLKAGIAGKFHTMRRHELLMALGRTSQLLAEIAAERQSAPLDMALAEQEIIATYAATGDLAAATKLKEAYMASYKATRPTAVELADVEAFFGAPIALFAGDVQTYARQVSRFKHPFYQFRAAFAFGDLTAAAALAQEHFQNNSDTFLLLYLAAQRSVDAETANAHFAAARRALQVGSPDSRTLAALLEDKRPDAKAVCSAQMDIESKRILLTAMGVRCPDDREEYFAMARKLNFNPQFPHQFLTTYLKE